MIALIVILMAILSALFSFLSVPAGLHAPNEIEAMPEYVVDYVLWEYWEDEDQAKSMFAGKWFKLSGSGFNFDDRYLRNL